jgi:hypothetical protein
MNANTTPIVLRAASEGEGKPLPLGLEGYPLEADGTQIHYRRMRIARAGNWTHRGTGEPVAISRERMDEWVKNTAALAAAGVKPFLPGQHRSEFNAADNHGYVLSLARDGDDLFATVQLYGDDARRIAAANSRSIYVVKDARDAKGNVIPGESIAHVALVPNPALPDLGPTVKIAASAGGSPVEAPILEPAAPRSEPMFKPETKKNLLARLKLPDNTPDADLAEKTAAAALADPPAPPADVAALSASVTKLTKERDDAKAEVVRLSASAPKQPDPEIMRDRVDNYSQRIDLMMERGDLPKGVADKLKAKLKPEAVVMLSASADFDNKRPIDFVLSLFDGAKMGVPTGVSLVPRPTLSLAGTGQADASAQDIEDARKEAEAFQTQQLRARGLVA